MPGCIDDRYVEAWLLANQVEPDSRRGYRYALEQFDSYLGQERLCLSTVTKSDVERFAARLSRERRPSVASYVYNAVRRFCWWAAEEGVISSWRIVPRDPVITSRPYTRLSITAEEAARILDGAKDARQAAVLALVVRAGLKPREIVDANIGNFVRFGCDSEFQLPNGAWLPLTRACTRSVKPYIRQRESEGANWDDPLFVSRSARNLGQRVSARTLRTIVQTAVDGAGLPLEAAEYNLSSAALSMAIVEKEPPEVIMAIGDRTWAARYFAERFEMQEADRHRASARP